MDNKVFRAFLDLLMCADPWPIVDRGKSRKLLEKWADSRANTLGYANWIDAYHNLPKTLREE